MELLHIIIAGIFSSGIALFLVKMATKTLKLKKEAQVKRKKKLDELLLKKVIQNAIESEHECEDLLHKVGASRVLVLCSHNGTGLPTAGKPLYSTVIREAIDKDDKNVKPVKQDFQNQNLDGNYLGLLSRLQYEDSFWIHVEDMPESILKNIYKKANVNAAFVYKIVYYDFKFYYLSITWCNDNQAFAQFPDGFIQDECRISTNKHANWITDNSI